MHWGRPPSDSDILWSSLRLRRGRCMTNGTANQETSVIHHASTPWHCPCSSTCSEVPWAPARLKDGSQTPENCCTEAVASDTQHFKERAVSTFPGSHSCHPGHVGHESLISSCPAAAFSQSLTGQHEF
ncbi:unnamed protein product [Leuciscus chuanchicus]